MSSSDSINLINSSSCDDTNHGINDNNDDDSSGIAEKTIRDSSSSVDANTDPATVQGKSVVVNGSHRTKDLKEHDVVCEKGRGEHERWPGNKLYRHLINLHKETYNDQPPVERSSIIGKIITAIQEKEGWFVQTSDRDGTWTKLSEEKVRKKVSDDLRREIRRRREKRSNNSVFSAKLRAIKKIEENDVTDDSILEPVNDPQPTDVLFGPGARRHPGNKTYWKLMKTNLDQYIISPYGARSVISRNIVQCVSNQLGRFIEQDPKTGIWYHISAKRAIEKTSHALSNMKYKTRKSANEPIDFRLDPASLEDIMVYGGGDDDDDSSEEDTKILDSDSPRTVFAKKRTKKFRFLSRRMDDEDDNLTLESKASLKSAGSLEGMVTLKNYHGQQQSYHQTLLATPPAPGMTKSPVDGKIITPNDNLTRASVHAEARDDYHDYHVAQSPNSPYGGYHRYHHPAGLVAPGFPDGSEFGPMAGGYNNGRMPAADIGPRPSHYDAYLKGYGAGGLVSKPLTYDFGHSLPPHQPTAHIYNHGSSMLSYHVGAGGYSMSSHHQYWSGNDWTSHQRADGYY